MTMLRATVTMIAHVKRIVLKLSDELEALTGQGEELQRLAGEVGSDAQKAVQQVVSLPMRAEIVKKLIDALSRAIRLEREAFGIGDEPPCANGTDNVIKRLHQTCIPA